MTYFSLRPPNLQNRWCTNGYYKVDLSATIGGPGLGNARGNLSVGIIEFPTILKGAPLSNRADILRAFDSAKIKFSGVNLVVGTGISIGSFSIGNYSDPSPLVSASGLSIGTSKLGGYASVDKIEFFPMGIRK